MIGEPGVTVCDPPDHTAVIAEAARLARVIPDRHRRFTESKEQAEKLHGIPADLADQLVAVGMPHRQAENQFRFDQYDLISVAMMLRLPTPRLFGVRRWMAAMRAAVSGRPVEYMVKVLADPAGDPTGPPATLCPPIAELCSREDDGAGGQAHLIRHRVHGTSRELPPEYRAITDLVATVRHYFIPPVLSTDVDLVRVGQLANCESAAEYLVDEAARRGLAARTAFGVLFATPFSALHSWAEFEVDGEWLAADPLLLASMVEWGVAAPGEWPPHWSLGPATLRLAERPVSLATRDGAGVDVSLPTRKVARDNSDSASRRMT